MCDSGVSVAPIGTPSVPMAGWETVTEANYKDYVGKIPQVTAGIHMKKSLICIGFDSYKFITQEQCVHIWLKELGVLHGTVHFVLLQGGLLIGAQVE